MNNTLAFYGVICASAIMIAGSGCISLKTEHEVKPIEIHAVVDLNLKVDKKIEDALAKNEKPDIRKMMERGVVGLDNKAMLVPRGALSSEEMESVMEFNTRIKERRTKIAEEDGLSFDEVTKRSVAKWHERLTPGVWYQTEAGEWVQKQ